AEAALGDKLGSDSAQASELLELDFYFNPKMTVNGEPRQTPDRNKAAFDRDFQTAVALLRAALEASPRVGPGDSPLVHIEQVGNKAEAHAEAVANINVTADQLRTLLATSKELDTVQKGDAVAAVPDDDDQLITLERADKLLSVATKSKDLLTAVLGFLLANAHRIHF
ncbi:MAG: hypothetical protein ACRDJT_02570, partial [Actinomycetota bacterium]